MKQPLIAHTTDLSGNDDVAFEHAAAMALASRSRLASVHACVGPEPARELPHGPPGIPHVRLLHQCCDDATETLLDALQKLQPDLVITATHARTGVERLFAGSVAEAVARNLAVPVLLLPLDGTGFLEDGSVRLRRVLATAGTEVEAQAAIDAAARLAELAGVPALEVVLLHVGKDACPEPVVPERLRVERRRAEGAIEEVILVTAEAIGADALVMATRGHDGIGDVLLGSHTERVLQRCHRPLLSVSLL